MYADVYVALSLINWDYGHILPEFSDTDLISGLFSELYTEHHNSTRF